MCSRLFFAAAATLLLSATGSWAQFGGMPEKSFDGYERPPVPDYADRSAWAALPDMEDAADLFPTGSEIPEAQGMAKADVFYLHPTTYRGAENWNQDISMATVNKWTDDSVIARQASAFNGCCKIYAPRYRQATITALGAPDDSGTRAYALAYEDTLRAWKHYVDNWNNGRPFMIVSHSQGTLHAVKLLEEEIDGTPLADRMIAAYVIGIGINEGIFGRSLKTVTRCTGATDTGCVISWNTFARNGEPQAGVERLKQRYRDRFGTSDGEDIVCWNPIGMSDQEGDVPSDRSLGALAGKPGTSPLPPLIEGNGANCLNGTLYTDMPDKDQFELVLFGGGNLHMHDFDLFYGSIRANAVARTEAYLGQQTD